MIAVHVRRIAIFAILHEQGKGSCNFGNNFSLPILWFFFYLQAGYAGYSSYGSSYAHPQVPVSAPQSATAAYGSYPSAPTYPAQVTVGYFLFSVNGCSVSWKFLLCYFMITW